jgi:hypothetical protein
VSEKDIKDNEYDELIDLETELSASDEVNEIPPSDIVAFNELRSCFDLVRLHTTGKLDIQPDFQREVVWANAAQSKFIDSLAKQLPIPSMCIALDYKKDKRYMVDGLQRMQSIIQFLTDDKWRLSKLDDIYNELSGKKVSYIKEHSSDIYERVENTSIPVTVLRCDLENKHHQEYLFTIFHRLNAGGSRLNNQEIRNCIYQGTLNSLLLELSKTDIFKSLFDISDKKKYRFSNEELLLRALAHSRGYENYYSPLSVYLNDFMSDNREIDVTQFRDDLEFSINLIYEEILSGEPFHKTSKALIEALFVAIIRNKKTVESMSKSELIKRYELLRADKLFSLDSLKEGLAATDKVIARLTRAEEIFK